MKRGARIAIASAIASVAIVGGLHAPFARSLLARAGVHAGCPVTLEGHAPEEIEAARAKSVAPLREGDRARARPALGFALMQTSRADVRAWAAARGVTCEAELSATALRCRDLPARVTIDPREGIADLYLRFDRSGALVAVDAMHAPASAEDARAAIDAIADQLTRDAGPPVKTPSAFETAAYLAERPLHRDAFEFRFRDYAADVSATNFGERGIVVREQYRAIPD